MMQGKLSSAAKLRFGLFAILAMLMCSTTLNAQSFSVFDIDASSFPLMKAKFYAFDADGNQLSGLSAGDVLVQENGIPRTVTRVSCPPVSPPEALSSVLTIDVSGSMSGSGIRAAKAAARAWVGALPLGRSECAITTFNHKSYLNQDFTVERSALLSAIEALRPGGGTDFNQALLTPPAGALEVTKRGKNKKVIVFLSDGRSNTPNLSIIIAEAQRQNATIYGVILGMSAPQIVKDFCSQTGGLWFERITTELEAEEAYRRILQTAQGGSPCELEWISDGCDISRSLEITLTVLGLSVRASYEIPAASLPQLTYTPSRSLYFGEVEPGTKIQQQVTLTAQGRPVQIDRITTSHTCFSITDYGGGAPPFTLGTGQSRTLTVQYEPVDSTYAYSRFDVESDACRGVSFYASGGWTWKQSEQLPIEVIRANGGEQFVAGSDEELRWDGVMPEEKVLLEYSTDGGANWMFITDEATGLHYTWRVPKTPSNQCLLRATAKARPTFASDLTLIPAGTFRMGNITDSPYGGGDEKPVHEVTITRSFLMSRTEVTQAQYIAVMGNNPSNFTGDDHPVERVTWHEAVVFCNEISKLEGLDACYSGSGANTVCDFSANGYRLPTEAEWEYACRGGTETDFYTGNVTSSECSPLDAALGRAGWYCGNANAATQPVRLGEANNFGLYDMHGNVYEWCWDWYVGDYYGSSPAADPRGPDTGFYRVLRGGSWYVPAKHCRSAFRSGFNPDYRDDSSGFRFVRAY